MLSHEITNPSSFWKNAGQTSFLTNDDSKFHWFNRIPGKWFWREHIVSSTDHQKSTLIKKSTPYVYGRNNIDTTLHKPADNVDKRLWRQPWPPPYTERLLLMAATICHGSSIFILCLRLGWMGERQWRTALGCGGKRTGTYQFLQYITEALPPPPSLRYWLLTLMTAGWYLIRGSTPDWF